MARLVVGISGASGTILAIKALRTLCELGHEIELVITPGALSTATVEMGKPYATPRGFVSELPETAQKQITLHANNYVGHSICSGSYPTDGMLIIPCSMATVGAIAHGLGDNGLRRAADVILKERRPLVLVPRETPLHAVHLENMLKLTQMGATIVLPVPAWYLKPKTVDEIENYIVGKALDALKIDHSLYPIFKQKGGVDESLSFVAH
ncbi:MAG: putative UbiX-like flavin prenyltransferase [Chlamydiae bacterium]|nr:putative UbiX-like flavin prenyltransferase [Chlamydiota bacterium]